MLQARLITRRSQVQILPPLLQERRKRRFCVSEAGLARHRASALDVLPVHRSISGPVSAGRVILIVLGSIGVLLGLALMAGGGFLLWADRTQRDDGYLTTPTERFATPTYALTRTRLELDTDGEGWVLNESWFGKVRIRGESPAEKTLFIGIGPAGGGRQIPRIRRTRECPGPRLRSLPSHVPSDHGRRAASAADGAALLGGLRLRGRDTDAALEGARRRLVGRPNERRRLAWRRCGCRPRRQAVVPALGRDRDAPRRRARHRGKHRIDRPRRADAPAAAFATGTSYGGRRIRKGAGTRASRPLNRRGPA